MAGINRLLFTCCIIHIFNVADACITDSSWKLVKEIPGTYSNFYCDNLGNIFLLTTNNQLKKYNATFDSAGVFNDVRRYGDIFSADVNNPLKIAVYYKDFATIVVLDRFLNIRNTIDLRNTGIIQVGAVAQSYDNNYWIFDALENKLKKIDDNGKTLLQTPDFRLLFDEVIVPSAIIDEGGLLYMYSKNKGWLLFDYYGTYKKLVDMPGWGDVQARNKVLYGRDSLFLYAYDTNDFSADKITLDKNIQGVKKLLQKQHRIYVLNNSGLSIYNVSSE